MLSGKLQSNDKFLSTVWFLWRKYAGYTIRSEMDHQVGLLGGGSMEAKAVEPVD